MNTHELIITLIIIGAVIFAIVRQVMPQQVRVLPFVVFPLAAAYESYKLLPRPIIPGNQIIECMLVIIVGVAAGYFQATYTRVYYKGIQLYMCGGKVSLIVWIAVMLLRLIIEVLFQGISMFTSFRSFEWILWATVSATLGSRSIILYLKHPEIGKVLADERANRHKRRD